MNAREEFVEHAIDGMPSKIKAATISRGWCDDISVAELKVGYSEQDLHKFLENMNFGYDCGYGSQKLYGTIWYENGTWSSRGEYDGSEWWEHNVMPDIPEKFITEQE